MMRQAAICGRCSGISRARTGLRGINPDGEPAGTAFLCPHIDIRCPQVIVCACESDLRQKSGGLAVIVRRCGFSAVKRYIRVCVTYFLTVINRMSDGCEQAA